MENKSTDYNSENEIDLLEIFKTIWEGRKTVIKTVIAFGLIGLFIAVFSEKEYTAKTVLLPQTSRNNKFGNLGGFASMAGINLGNESSEGINPSLYTKIVSSVPFKRAIIKTSIDIPEVNDIITYEEYYSKYYNPGLLLLIKKYTIGLPKIVFNVFKGEKSKSNIKIEERKDSIYNISLKEKELFDRIDNQVSVFFDEDEGVVNIKYSMPDAVPAAQMTKSVEDLLQKAITELKVQKVKEELRFVQERYDDLKEEFIKKQAVLASFKDQNKGLVTIRSQIKLRRLELEYNLSYEVYSELAKKLETYKIKLKEDTPVFTVIEPVSIPTDKSKPKRGMIIAISVIFGAVIGVVLIFIKDVKNRFLKL